MSEATEPVGELTKDEVKRLVVRFVLGLVMVCSFGASVGYFVREPAEALAYGFVERFGVGGMALGTLLADAAHFPVPPQFYMLLAIASKTHMAAAFPAIAAASLLAGGIGYRLAKRLARVRWLAEPTKRYRRLLGETFARRGYRAALLASLLPVPYSVLCTLAGLTGLPTGFVVLLGVYRVPKLLGFYGLVYLGWSLA